MIGARIEKYVITPPKDFEGRIEWCDIYKGIIILLVVIGHCTGYFNQWIYQFHMAAFFFISGYTSREDGSLFDYIIKRFYQLMFPYYSINLLGIISFWVLNKINVLGYISTTEYPPRFRDALLGLFNNSAVYCDYLGAMWFMPVLFFAGILLKVITLLFHKKWIILMASILIYLSFMKSGLSGSLFFIKLGGMAQLFLVYGYLLKKMLDVRRFKVPLLIGLSVIIASIWNLNVSAGFYNTVDWPSARFNGWSDMLLPILGISLSVLISVLLTKCGTLKKLFLFLGNKSMGIMCFHFIGFKIAYLILIAIGCMSFADFNLLTPSSLNLHWECILIITVSILFSVMLWCSLNRFRWLRVFLGSDREFIAAFLRIGIVQEIKAKIHFVFASTGKVKAGFIKYYRQHSLCKWVLFFIVAAICILFLEMKVYLFFKPIEVTFPYNNKIVTFDEGWLPQSTSEEYRWIKKNSVFEAFIINQKMLTISGYIPKDVTDMTYCKVRVNGKEVYSSNAQEDFLINIQKIDISDYVKRYTVNTFEIELDGMKYPSESDVDQREISALINSILVE